jgi:hypothetical protein
MTRSAAAASAVGTLLSFVVFVATGCVSDVPIGFDRQPSAGAGAGTAGGGASAGGSSGGGTGGGGAAGTDTSGSGGANAGETGGSGDSGSGCNVTRCGNTVYTCGDCEDNDGDGAIDAADGQCLGPCDDTEASYYPNIPGQNGGSCRQDCYFDKGVGANDQCFSSFRCDPLAVLPDYPPNGEASCAYDESTNISGTNASCAELREAQSDACGENCGPLVPNGCDCFGCCELPAQSENYVWIGSLVDGAGSCNEATVTDPSACKPCTPFLSCLNTCEECEICAGRPLPGPDCAETGGEQCTQGRAPCGLPGQPLCPAGQYCITGCCVIEPR